MCEFYLSFLFSLAKKKCYSTCALENHPFPTKPKTLFPTKTKIGLSPVFAESLATTIKLTAAPFSNYVNQDVLCTLIRVYYYRVVERSDVLKICIINNTITFVNQQIIWWQRKMDLFLVLVEMSHARTFYLPKKKKKC